MIKWIILILLTVFIAGCMDWHWEDTYTGTCPNCGYSVTAKLIQTSKGIKVPNTACPECCTKLVWTKNEKTNN